MHVGGIITCFYFFFQLQIIALQVFHMPTTVEATAAIPMLIVSWVVHLVTQKVVVQQPVCWGDLYLALAV